MNIEQLYSDNGFTSLLAMEQSHKPLVAFLRHSALGDVTSILDLGCGNGLLLKKTKALYPNAVLYGIDIDTARIERAKALKQNEADTFAAGDMYDVEHYFPNAHFDLVLLMAGRLELADDENRRKLVNFLRSKVKTCLAYVYDDWVTKGRTLPVICEEQSLRILRFEKETNIGLISPDGPD